MVPKPKIVEARMGDQIEIFSYFIVTLLVFGGKVVLSWGFGVCLT